MGEVGEEELIWLNILHEILKNKNIKKHTCELLKHYIVTHKYIHFI